MYIFAIARRAIFPLLAFGIHVCAFAQGSLTPPGAPAATMKSLDQVEARTPISSVPYTITASGSFYLTTNVTATVSNAIVIAASGVTLDLNGFTITSSTASANGSAILINGSLRDITIVNGHISSGVVNNGGGVFSGPGFRNGIYCSGTSPVSTRIAGVSVSGCLGDGIGLTVSIGGSIVVDSCTVQTVGGVGIRAAVVSHSVAVDCGQIAIYGDQVSNCRGESVGIGGEGIYANTVENCRGITTTNAAGIRGYLVQNSYGSGGTGIDAVASAINCYGVGAGGQGINTQTANNCYGQSITSQGINAQTANTCYGYSSLNRGISTSIANSCYGASGGGSFGIFATYIANTSYGTSSTGTGLTAYIAIGCTGSSVTYTYHYNMPP